MCIRDSTNREFGVKVSILCPQAVKTNMTLGREKDVAAIDGMLEPEVVAAEVLMGIKDNKFLKPNSSIKKIGILFKKIEKND